MNAIVQKSQVEEFVDTVLDKDRMTELADQMPEHVNRGLFKRNLLNAVMANYELLDYPPGLVFREVSKAAALGLFLDPQLGEAYLIIRYNFKTKQKEPALQPGYRGLIKLAKQSGEILQIYAHEVCEKDFIDCELGLDKRLIHRPTLFSDRGPIIGYYAVMKFKNGEADFEPMSVADVHKIRDRADAWKAFADGKIKSTPWSTDESEMAKKTVIKRLIKRAPQSPELAEAIRLDDRDFELQREQSRVPRLARVAPPPPTEIEHKPATPMESIETREPENVEVPPPPPPAAMPSPQSDSASQGDLLDFEALRKRFAGAAQAATDIDQLNDAWMTIVESEQEYIFPPDFSDLQSIYRRRERELEP